MSSSAPIENSNLSLAWAEAFLALMQPRYAEITPLVVTVSGINGDRIDEHEGIRKMMDKALAQHRSSCNTVANGDEKPVNQLEHVIATWQKGNHRHSALQLSVFDPRRDHTDCRQMGFPCLHQVCFTPFGTNGCAGLAVTGFYATQHIFEKAYGNYLGLCRLGQFVAHETNLRLVRMTCIAASARLGNVEKTDVASLAAQLRDLVSKLSKT